MRLFKYAIKNIVRNSFLSFSSIITIALIAFFISILFFVHHFTFYFIENINQKLTISLNLKSGYTNLNSEVTDLRQDIKSTDNRLKVDYISAEDALKKLGERDPDLVRVIETSKENPLPASIKISDIELDVYAKLNDTIKKYSKIIVYDEAKTKKLLIDYQSQYSKIQALTLILQAVQYAIYAILAFFAFAVFALIYSTIGNFVFSYRWEIRIIRLVGGDNIFVYGPFSIQWWIYALIGWILSLSLFFATLNFLKVSIWDDFAPFISQFLSLYAPIFFWELVGLVCIGVVSGFVSSVRFVTEQDL